MGALERGDGYPFDRELAELRREQRRRLRCLDRSLVSQAARRLDDRARHRELPEQADRPLAELYLRRVIGRNCDEVGDDGWEPDVEPALAAKSYLWSVDDADASLLSAAEEAQQVVSGRRTELPKGQEDAIRAALFLMILADELAQDGYRDPRLPAE